MNLASDWIGSLSGIEAIWIALAVTGAAVSISNALDAWADLRAVGGLKNGRRLLAVGAVRREVLRLLIYTMYVFIGVFAGLTPALPGQQLSFVAAILVFTSLILTTNSVLDRHERIALMSGQSVDAKKAADREDAVTVRENAATVREDLNRLMDDANRGPMERMADSMDRTEAKALVVDEKAAARAAAPRAQRQREEDKDFGDKRRDLEDEHREEDNARAKES